MIRSVVIDLDDTLIASARARSRGRAYLRGLGVDPRRFAAADRRWWRTFTTGQIGIDDLRMGRMADAGLAGPAARAADLEYRRIANVINLRRGARALLSDLRGAGLRTVILTNGTVEPQRGKVVRAGLEAMVDAVLVSEESGFQKPDRRAFEAALGLIDGTPSEAAMVGDTDYADIEGALAAGFSRAVWVARPGRRPHADPRVATVTRLAAVLPALLGNGLS